MLGFEHRVCCESRSTGKERDAESAATATSRFLHLAKSASAAQNDTGCIFEFAEGKRKYVGQSQSPPDRLKQHQRTGRLQPGIEANVTPVKGGKTARELAETKRINELGGTRDKPGSKTTNQRLSVSPRRQKKLLGE